MKAVLKLGGFVFDEGLPPTKIDSYAKVIKAFSRKNQMIVVTGGGPIARRYIAAARALGASETFCDQIGIQVSRLNAQLLAAALEGTVSLEIPESIEDMTKLARSGLVVVMGGLQPGQSTNAAAALAAEVMRADLLVNATSVSGVYSADPRKGPHAVKLAEVTPDELSGILSGAGFRAGEYELMDPVAIRIIKRSKIPVLVIDGQDASNIDKALHGKHIGTRVVPTKG
jgi:uridylate kinase